MTTIVVPANTSRTIIDHGENHDITVNGKLLFVSVLTKDTNATRTIRLEGKGSVYREFTVFVGDKSFDVTSNVVNNAEESTACVAVRGVLTGNGKANVVGNMKIVRGACKSDSRLSQHVLLASVDARANTLPNLEIDENDVSAGHASTVRPLNAEHVFYLTSRGLSEKEARQLLIRSFLLLDELPEEIRKEVEVPDVLLA